MSLPLAGVLVADFSRVLAGPLAAVTLADLGADVIKVERPSVGDDTRHWGPPWTETSSSYFECANRSKKSVELDLDDSSDLRLAQELAGRCDVLIENFRTGTLERRGLGYADVAARNPAVVYCIGHRLRQRGGRAPSRIRLPHPSRGRIDEHHRYPTGANQGGCCPGGRADIEGRRGGHSRRPARS